MAYRVAILGATGLVGQELIKLLEQRAFPAESITLLSSEHPSGKKMFVAHREVEVKEASSDSFRGIDLAFFTGGAEASREHAAAAVQVGTVVIDTSSAFRMMPNVPLVVPEVNSDDIKSHHGVIAVPGCSTIQLVTVLFPLHRANPIKRVVVATYEPVSSTGGAGIEELATQSKQVLDGQAAVPHVFPHQIAFNLLPEVDVFLDNGYTREEWKMVEESKKVMHADDMVITATCVRVPVFRGHSAAVNCEFEQPISAEEARQILARAPGVKVLDDPIVSLYPQPWSVTNTDEVFVGRIRQDSAHTRGIAMWLVVDNIRKGAALTAVQIAEETIRHGLIPARGEK